MRIETAAGIILDFDLDGSEVRLHIDTDGPVRTIYLERADCEKLGKYLTAAAVILTR